MEYRAKVVKMDEAIDAKINTTCDSGEGSTHSTFELLKIYGS